MLCQDTAGELPAIHISKPAIELAAELMPILDAIQAYGQGDGQITIPVKHGHIPFIDWAFRYFRNKKKIVN